MKTKFVSPEELKRLRSQDLRKDASPQALKMAREADEAFNEINHLVSNFSSENRLRAAGYLPSEAEDLAYLMKDKNIQIGEIFTFKGKSKVLTPFNTVVDAQVYITTLQSSLITFTTMSFFGLIKYAFKQLVANLRKGKLNG